MSDRAPAISPSWSYALSIIKQGSSFVCIYHLFVLFVHTRILHFSPPLMIFRGSSETFVGFQFPEETHTLSLFYARGSKVPSPMLIIA